MELSSSNIKKRFSYIFPKAVLIFPEMKTFSSNIKKILMFSEKKDFLTFSQKKTFLIFP